MWHKDKHGNYSIPKETLVSRHSSCHALRHNWKPIRRIPDFISHSNNKNKDCINSLAGVRKSNGCHDWD